MISNHPSSNKVLFDLGLIMATNISLRVEYSVAGISMFVLRAAANVIDRGKLLFPY